jgi:hypothetical protein
MGLMIDNLNSLVQLDHAGDDSSQGLKPEPEYEPDPLLNRIPGNLDMMTRPALKSVLPLPLELRELSDHRHLQYTAAYLGV